jgi:cytochrome oxidase assembly protein ShyY1
MGQEEAVQLISSSLWGVSIGLAAAIAVIVPLAMWQIKRIDSRTKKRMDDWKAERNFR